MANIIKSRFGKGLFIVFLIGLAAGLTGVYFYYLDVSKPTQEAQRAVVADEPMSDSKDTALPAITPHENTNRTTGTSAKAKNSRSVSALEFLDAQIEEYRNKLTVLEERKKALQQRLSPDHPDNIALQRDINIAAETYRQLLFGREQASLSQSIEMGEKSSPTPLLRGLSVPPRDPAKTADLSKADIGYTIPETMTKGKTETIVLLIDDTKSVRKNTATMQGLIESETTIAQHKKIETATIEVSTRMEAILTGNDFTITEITPREQLVREGGNRVWKWDIVTDKTGELPLHIAVNAIIEHEGKTTRQYFDSYDKTIIVSVTKGAWLKEFWIKYWQWIISTILLPLFGYIGTLIYKHLKMR